MKIAVAGIGYVGLSLSILLSQKHQVIAYDIQPDKVNLLNQFKSPIKDTYIEKYLSEKKLNLTATTNYEEAFKGASFIIIATPTNYDEIINRFDTTSVEQTIEKALAMAPKNSTIIIKSTVPVGYTKSIQQKYHTKRIIFSPEFLREGKALYDNLYPSRIIVGSKAPTAHQFANLLLEGSLKSDVNIQFTNSTEAEAIKLFANTYLAMRIAYFNELDTYAEIKNLNPREIIDGICADPRIGNHYNNPSFGYGGYCLPKDTKQLLVNFSNVPNNIISAIVSANVSRKQHIINMILRRHPQTVGIYRLTMKSNSDNFRFSAIHDIIKSLQDSNIDLIIYEPTINSGFFENIPVINDLSTFKTKANLIVANRTSDELSDVKSKVYTRDLFSRD